MSRLFILLALLASFSFGTAHAADALGRSDLGRLRPGGPAELVVVRPPPGEPAAPEVIIQHVGGASVWAVRGHARWLVEPAP